MRKLKWLLLALPALAILMAPTGGYPSRPTFQTVKVTGPINAGSLAVASAPATSSLSSFSAPAGKYSQVQLGSGGSYFGLCVNDTALTCGLNMAAGDSTIFFTGNTLHFQDFANTDYGTIGVGGLTVKGVAVPKVSYATCAAAGGFSSTTQHSNVTSCVRNGVGFYTVNFASAYSAVPTCTAAISNAGVAIVSVIPTLTTSVNIGGYTTAASSADVIFSISCFGT